MEQREQSAKPSDSEVEDGEGVIALIENFKNFFRCGGTVTWQEWSNSTAESQALMIEASEQLDVERCTLLSVCLSSPSGASEVYSRIDGGDAFVRRSLLESVARMCVRK